MRSIAITKRRGFWSWPGPARTYEAALLAIAFLPVLYFRQSGFTMSATAAVIICATYISAVLRTDLTVKDWGNLNRNTIWIIRTAAVAVACWMFVDAPGQVVRYLALLLYAALYVGCETAVWQRKRAIESADANMESGGIG